MRKKGDIRQGIPLKFTKITKKRKKALKYMKSSCILLHAVALIAVKREVVASLWKRVFPWSECHVQVYQKKSDIPKEN